MTRRIRRREKAIAARRSREPENPAAGAAGARRSIEPTQLSVPRLLGIVAVLEGLYVLGHLLLNLPALDSGLDFWRSRLFWGPVWAAVLFSGAYVLWLKEPAASLWSALVRTLLIWAVIVITALFVLGLFYGPASPL